MYASHRMWLCDSTRGDLGWLWPLLNTGIIQYMFYGLIVGTTISVPRSKFKTQLWLICEFLVYCKSSTRVQMSCYIQCTLVSYSLGSLYSVLRIQSLLVQMAWIWDAVTYYYCGQDCYMVVYLSICPSFSLSVTYLRFVKVAVHIVKLFHQFVLIFPARLLKVIWITCIIYLKYVHMSFWTMPMFWWD